MTPRPWVQKKWGLAWRSTSKLDGEEYYVMGNLRFDTRREAREYRDHYYGYIRRRPDLKSEPHGWQMPKVIRVVITVQEQT